MELATGILLAANAQENFEHLGQDFAHQVDVMVARLHACVSGQPAETGAEVPGLDEMSRRAQERLLNSQVAKEIQTNLVQIEQVLDAFFRDVSRRGDLAGLDMPLKQVTGALTILGQDAAVATLADCSARIARFSAPGGIGSNADPPPQISATTRSSAVRLSTASNSAAEAARPAASGTGWAASSTRIARVGAP